MQPVYEGKDNKNSAAMTLDSDFVYISDFYLEVLENEPKLYSILNNGYHSIAEEFENQRFDRVTLTKYPDVVMQYSTSSLPYKVTFSGNTLTQKSPSKLSRVAVYPDTPESRSLYAKSMQEMYDKRHLEKE